MEAKDNNGSTPLYLYSLCEKTDVFNLLYFVSGANEMANINMAKQNTLFHVINLMMTHKEKSSENSSNEEKIYSFRSINKEVLYFSVYFWH